MMDIIKNNTLLALLFQPTEEFSRFISNSFYRGEIISIVNNMKVKQKEILFLTRQLTFEVPFFINSKTRYI